ncbi:flavodoxin family protein [Myxococcota bacterium]|nr:flavodoxin family protein [Myxococcota bacterium]MBU1535100.1 flavodoxin family protein [Myxococcota bacterium]
MNVLAIFGSPRREGNSAAMMAAALDALPTTAHIRRIYLADLNIAPCGACRECKTTGACAIHDDMEGIVPDITWAEVILISTPTHFSGVCSNVQSFMERTWCMKGMFKNKIGGTLVSGRRYLESSVNTLRAFMLRHNMILGNAGALGFSFTETGGLEQDPLAFTDAQKTAIRVTELHGLLHSNAKQ